MKNNLRLKSLIASVFVVATFIFTSTVSAITIADLLAQIKFLQAQLLTLQNAGTQTTTFTQNLTLGSTGLEVEALQKMLVSQGYLVMPTGVSFGYFGSLTQTALAKWQQMNGVMPAVGYWGPVSRSKYLVLANTKNTTATSQSVASVSGSTGGGASVPSSSTSQNQTPSSSGGGGGSSTPAPSSNPPAAENPAPQAPSTPIQESSYPIHTTITAAVFWVGEPKGNGSSEDNALSAWDDAWQEHYGGYDDYSYVRTATNNYFPTGFTPKENPFYLDLPYNDFNNNGTPKSNRVSTVPWASEKVSWGNRESMMKNRWVKITKGSHTCYGQIQDAGPYVYDDSNYVFGTNDERPKNTQASSAGMDVSPALRDCLGFSGLNNVSNKVSWQFVNATDVPDGPWKIVITTRQIYWP